MIGHLVGALEPEGLSGRTASYTQFIDDSFIPSTAQKLKINYSFPACTSCVRVGMTGFSKVPNLYAAAAALAPNSDANISTTCRSALLLPAKSVMNC